jgi:parallel beta-helix repeat protein
MQVPTRSLVALACGLALGGLRPAAGQDATTLPIVEVRGDDTVVDRSCRLVFPAEPIRDVNGDGVVHVTGSSIRVECEGRLVGRAPGTEPDAYAGTGIVVRGQRVELVGARVSGFKVGILVDGAFAARVEGADVSDNFRQRLGSTWEREDPSDWLWPHANDEGEWLENYGAGLCVRDARDVQIVRLFARDVQNGIVLDRATRARVWDCDASYLSGWGCALWRSTDCGITGNRFDHCVRGYAHGRYNRGQDSAGLLMFEQCSNNRILANSVTHGGDGVFAFAGREALGEVAPPPGPDGAPFDHRRAGNVDNIVRYNDLSFAAAHGLELTFSFGNLVEGNLFEGNAICGAWLGYSRDTSVLGNRFVANGTNGYGSERGAVNAEHAQRLSITGNLFESNAVDVRLWTDEDSTLAATPWVRANGRGARDNWVVGNLPLGQTALELVETGTTAADATGDFLVADETSRATLRPMPGASSAYERSSLEAIDASSLDLLRIVTLRKVGLEGTPRSMQPRGREHIVVGEWGPYDWSTPWLQPLERGGAFARYRLLGPAGTRLLGVEVIEGAVEIQIERASNAAAPVAAIGPDGLAAAVVVVRPTAGGMRAGYRLRARVAVGDEERVVELVGSVLALEWDVRFAAWSTDPREDDAVLSASLDAAESIQVPSLDLAFDGRGPVRALERLGVATSLDGTLVDRFGTRATTQVELAAGTWRLRTVSDDGIRIRVDGATVLDDWTWHGPKEQSVEFEVSDSRSVEIVVEHFELDGWAQLLVELDAVDASPDEVPQDAAAGSFVDPASEATPDDATSGAERDGGR